LSLAVFSRLWGNWTDRFGFAFEITTSRLHTWSDIALCGLMRSDVVISHTQIRSSQ